MPIKEDSKDNRSSMYIDIYERERERERETKEIKRKPKQGRCKMMSPLGNFEIN